MKRYGYHRTSTREQHLDRGIKEITAYCEQNNLELEKIFTDQQTGKNFNRTRYRVLKNQWIDDEGRVYIQYQLSEIQADMNISKRKAGECLNELQDMGLILKRKGGNGYPSRRYVKNFTKRI